MIRETSQSNNHQLPYIAAMPLPANPPDPHPLQPFFLRLHKTLRINRAERTTLAQKRDILKRDLRTGLNKIFELFPTRPPKFRIFNQGSYLMNTAIRPLPQESFDIDVGILFQISRRDYSNPVMVKRWVFEALNRNYYRQVAYRRPCIRVEYQPKQKTQSAYHVDLAVYAQEPGGSQYLAWGMPHSQAKLRYWEAADPKGLRDYLEQRMGKGPEGKQARRLIALLKRWKDRRFPAVGNQRPTGIALTVAVCQHFRHMPGNDLMALRHVLQGLSGWAPTVSGIYLPVKPHNDLLGKMSYKQKQNLAAQLARFQQQLQRADASAQAGKTGMAEKLLGQIVES